MSKKDKRSVKRSEKPTFKASTTSLTHASGDLAQFKGLTLDEFAQSIERALNDATEAKSFVEQMATEGLLTLDYKTQYHEWINGIRLMINCFGDELIAHPDILSNIATIESVRSFNIITVEDVIGAIRASANSVPVADVTPDDKAIPVAVIIAIVIGVVAIAAAIYVSQETVQTLISHTNATARLAIVNACMGRAANHEERLQCLQAASQTRPEEKKGIPWLLIGLGVAALGAGYWLYKKQGNPFAELEDFEDAP